MAEIGISGIGRNSGQHRRFGADGQRLPVPVASGRLAPWPWQRLVARLEQERDRWFLWVPVLYGAGVALYFALPDEPRLDLVMALLAIAIVLRAVLTRGTATIALTGAVLAVMLGFATSKIRTLQVAAPVIARQLSGAEVRGWIELVEPRAGRGERLTIRVASIRGLRRERLPQRIRVTTRTVLAGLAPGVPVRLKATIAPPPTPALPGGYDFARMAYFRQLGGVGYALAAPVVDASVGPAPWTLQAWAGVAYVRQAISRRVRDGLPGEIGAIADALITGERGGISEATNDAYRGSGIFHLLSISGLHMTVMAGAVFFSTRFLLSAVPAIALSYPVKKWAAVLATLAALGYLLISGGAFATVRSWAMISVMFLAVLLDRPAVTLRNVAVSALVILLVMPESLLDIGFQMSYAAVVALVSAYEAMRMRDRDAGSQPDGALGAVVRPLGLLFGGIILTTLIAGLAVAPFGIYHFNNSQQYAVLANLIAIPVCNLVVMPAALATLLVMPLGLEAAPLWVMGIGITAMNWCAFAVSALPGAVVKVAAIPVAAFALMVIGGLWLTLWRTRWRLAGVALIAAGVAIAPARARPDILIGADGNLVAVRGADGLLLVLAGRRTRFELSRWLQFDGDGRTDRDAAARGGFRCDSVGCAIATKGVEVVVARHAAALAEDCTSAGILIMTFPRPPACVRDGPVIDLWQMKDNGAHAIYLGGGKAGMIVAIETVAGTRGDRPWVRQMRPGMPGASTGDGRSQGPSASRLGQFAAPVDLTRDSDDVTPEEADQDGTLPR